MKIAAERDKGKRRVLPRIPRQPGDDDFPIPWFKLNQFSVRVCFVPSISKKLGQSFSGAIGLDLRKNWFTHGQLYVAILRIAHPSNIHLFSAWNDYETTDEVYKIVLPTSQKAILKTIFCWKEHSAEFPFTM